MTRDQLRSECRAIMECVAAPEPNYIANCGDRLADLLARLLPIGAGNVRERMSFVEAITPMVVEEGTGRFIPHRDLNSFVDRKAFANPSPQSIGERIAEASVSFANGNYLIGIASIRCCYPPDGAVFTNFIREVVAAMIDQGIREAAEAKQ